MIRIERFTFHLATAGRSSVCVFVEPLHRMNAKQISLIARYVKPLTLLIVDYIQT